MRHTRLQPVFDAAVVLWVALWIWAGVVVGHGVSRLAELGDTAGQLGDAVTSIGRSLGQIPIIGGGLSGAVESDLAADLRAGRHAALADAELDRLEIRRPST